MELRFNIDDNLIEGLKQRTNTERASDLGREAFALLEWATKETQNGLRVQAVGSGVVHVPISPSLGQSQYQRW